MGQEQLGALEQVLQPVLQAKLDPGRSSSFEIARPRLLSAGPSAMAVCTVVQAPAGYGKTTLLRNWRKELSDEGKAACFLRCDRDDNSVAAFLRGLTTSLSAAGLDGLPRIDDVSAGPAWKPLLAAIIVAIDRAGCAVWVMLDDFHEITDPVLRDALSFLLSYAPAGFHLVLSGRRRPFLPLAHLAASGQVRWIRTGDLRFDLAETRQFLQAQVGAELDPFDIEHILEATQGWPAGLRLVVADIARSKRKEDAVAALEKVTPGVRDYFMECVLAGLSPDACELLPRAALLDEMSRPACNALIGGQETDALFNLLARGDLFAEPRDEGGDSYAFHPLFRSFLIGRLTLAEVDIAPLHRRAGQFFADAGQWPQAVQHAFAGGDTQAGLSWAQRCAGQVIGKGDPLRVANWVSCFPGEELNDRWPLLAAVGTAYALSLRLDDARTIAATIEGIVATNADRGEVHELSRGLKALWLCIAYMSDDIPLMVTLADRYSQASDGDDQWPHLMVSNALIHGNLLAGNIDRARQFEPLGQAEMDEPDSAFSVAYQMCLLGLCDVAELKLTDAEARFSGAYHLVDPGSGGQTAATALCASLLAAIHYEHDELETSESLLFGCLEQIGQTGFVEALQNCYLTLARIHAARQDWKVAHSILDRGAIIARRRSLPRLRGACLAERIDFALRQGQIGKAQTLLSELGWIAPEAGIAARSAQAYVRQLHLRASGVVAMACGRTKQACSIFERYIASDGWDAYAILRTRIHFAAALEAEGKLLQAQDQMATAVISAAPGNLVRSFLDAGPAARKLLGDVLPRLAGGSPGHEMVGYLARLSNALDRHHAGDAPRAKPRPSQISALTEREIRLLACVRRGLTNKEIAGELGIGVETVKWHLKNVFGKLKVRNRAEAVACAVEDPWRP